VGERTDGWAWSQDEIERVGARVGRMVAGYLSGLAERPVHRGVPGPVRAAWSAEVPPVAGESVDELLDRFEAEIAPYPFGNGHPGFYAWVNSPPSVIGVFAEALAAAMNPSVAGGDHAAVHLERQVIRWLAELAGLPPGAGGLLVSGASMATLTALAVARHRALASVGVDVREAGVGGAGARADVPPLRVYATAEAHGCVRKAVELLGLGTAGIREIETNADFTMRPSHLAKALAADQARGELPVAVVASAGTVNTGAIDPLAEISDVCTEAVVGLGAAAGPGRVWLHVDGAYGGPAVLLSGRYPAAAEAIGRADSIAIDPHKWLYVPVDAGVILLAEPELARAAFSLVPDYLRTGEAAGAGAGEQPEPWFSEYGFEQTRPFRALKIWMTMRYLGLARYRELIGHDLELASYLTEQIEAAPDLELLASGLSVVCFRYRPGGPAAGSGWLDDLNRQLVQAVQQGGRAYLAGTSVGGRQALRACIVNPGARFTDLDQLLAEVRTNGARLAAAG
jgi:aromatic-L-amino-acid/L-tryptophan decarboxylase